MKDYLKCAEELIKTLTLEEKCSLLSGKNFWFTREIKDKLPSIMMADGPNGLRKMPMTEYNGVDVEQALPAVCYPPAVTMACTFNPELIQKTGAAIAGDAKAENVSLLLAPGVNIKRSPLCGRNFEYYSEDPLLGGVMGASFITGVQSGGVGATVKHFALNNQENYRMTVNAVCDERAKREIYYKPFEIAVKARPEAVMSSYNRIDGIYTSENKELLQDILCGEWGYEGMTVSDWAAVNDRVESLKNNLHLEMPGGVTDNNNRVLNAVKSGEITEELLNGKLLKTVELILRSADRTEEGYKIDIDAHRKTAREVATEGAVLLKNDGMLPLKTDEKYLVAGELFEFIRYQGSGSSLINPERLITHKQAFDESGIKYSYVKGYLRRTDKTDKKILEEAVKAAAGYDKVIIFAGLPALFESEGYDRKHMKIPDNQLKLIDGIAAVCPNVTVVLTGGSVMEIPFENKVKSILCAYLCGQEGAYAIADILTGRVNPSGRLAETWGVTYNDYPAAHTASGPVVCEYRDSIFVGYRYFDTAGVKVRYPFGYGLSYTKFEYTDIKTDKALLKNNDKITVTVTVKNAGGMDGHEVIQLYTGKPESGIMRPVKELKAFKKVFVAKGETKAVNLELNYSDLAVYSAVKKQWVTEAGIYNIYIGENSEKINFTQTAEVEGEILTEEIPLSYQKLYPFNVSGADFEKLYGRKIPENKRNKKPYHYNTEIGDINKTFIGRIIYKKAMPGYSKKQIAADENLEILISMFKYGLIFNPLRAVILSSGGLLNFEALDAMLLFLNGKRIRAIKKIWKHLKKLKNFNKKAE